MVLNLFSKRQKRLRGEVPDTYSYDELSKKLRTQIVYALTDFFNVCSGYVPSDVVSALRREYGVFKLVEGNVDNDPHELLAFVTYEQDVEKVLDAIDLSIRFGARSADDYGGSHEVDVRDHIRESLIPELNARFQEDGFGHRIEHDSATEDMIRVIRVDSEWIHAEIVKPALVVLSQRRYEGARDEFLEAHKRYRHGDYKAAVVDCHKAFESVMKSICNAEGWEYGRGRVTDLIEACLGGGIVPNLQQSQLTSLRTLLESGLPTIRNKMAGHGQGVTPTPMPRHLAAYALHMTASTIVFLAEAHEEMKKN